MCTLKVFPQNVNLPISVSVFGFIQQELQTFDNGIDTGIYEWEYKVGLHRRLKTRVVRIHTQNRSLTCGKDRMTNCYSLSNNSKLLWDLIEQLFPFCE